MEKSDFIKMLMLNRTSKSKNAKDELDEFNITREHERLTKIKGEMLEIDKGIKLLCEYIMKCVEEDPINGDYYSEENMEKAKRAGEYLNKYDGTSMMEDTLEAWVPKRYRNEISHAWNGIGNWLA